MQLYARNNYLIVEVLQEKQETPSGILLPEDYKTEDSLFKAVKLLDAQPGSEFFNQIGNNLIVTSHLIQEVKAMGQKFTIVPFSAVVAAFMGD